MLCMNFFSIDSEYRIRKNYTQLCNIEGIVFSDCDWLILLCTLCIT